MIAWTVARPSGMEVATARFTDGVAATIRPQNIVTTAPIAARADVAAAGNRFVISWLEIADGEAVARGTLLDRDGGVTPLPPNVLAATIGMRSHDVAVRGQDQFAVVAGVPIFSLPIGGAQRIVMEIVPREIPRRRAVTR